MIVRVRCISDGLRYDFASLSELRMTVACETRCNVKHIMCAEKQRHQMSNFTADLESAPDDVGLDKQSEG